MRRHWSIRTAVFVAPATIIALMVGAMLVFDMALRTQQAEYERVVHGPITRATTVSTRLLLDVADVQAAVIRYIRLQRQHVDDAILEHLRAAILEQYSGIVATVDSLKNGATGPDEMDVVANIQDFLTIHRAVSTAIVEGGEADTLALSTIMAHYQQLQNYIAAFAVRSLESAKESVATTEKRILDLSRAVMLGSGLAILVAIVITVSAGRAISRPMTALIAILTSIAEGKHVTEVPARDRRDEIGAMARAISVFNSVTQDLREHQQSLIEARQAAELANEVKSAFVANVSHELRTPLTSVLGFTQIIRRRLDRVIRPALPADDARVAVAMEQIDENIDIIRGEGARLTTLINNVLDLEKIEAGGPEQWDIEPIGVADIVHQAAEVTRSLYTAKGIPLRIHVDADVTAVQADHDKLLQVLVNLISNAVKFTERGHIECVARMPAPERVEFSVTDTGCGMSADDQAVVFDKFRQVGSTLTDKPSGTGLGLSICREIVTRLGGQIWVESEVGVGSRFSFWLPAARPADEQV